jgi:hypothetical protein
VTSLLFELETRNPAQLMNKIFWIIYLSLALPYSSKAKISSGADEGVTVDMSGSNSISPETKEQHDARMAWWREAEIWTFYPLGSLRCTRR